MAYQVIARKWRPQTFTDVVGQSHITQTLWNALKNGRIHHALLFTGPRGTGKTSSARILAKALRCPNAVDFTPCNVCDSCKEIAAGRSLDVQELDAASNNSIDDVRRLLDGVMNAPATGLWKIYIVDEVHMLSTSAFNALLKTLEEPPAHVLFILATTDAHKIPETILSRVQRYDFKRISTRQMTERLQEICKSEGVEAQESALWMIARQGDGSLRDSQSLLDQVITFASGPLTEQLVTEILGLTERQLIWDTLTILAERNSVHMVSILERLSKSNVEAKNFINDLLMAVRNLMIVKISGAGLSELLDLPDSDLKNLAELATKWTDEDAHMLFDMALKGANDISRAQDPKLVLDVVMMRLASAPRITDLTSLMAKAGSMSLGPAAGAHAPAVPQEVVATGKTPQDKWLSFVDLVRAKDAFFAAKIENLLFQGEDGKTLKIGIPPKMVFLREQMANPEIRKKLKALIDSLWGQGYSFEITGSSSSPSASTPAGESAQTLAGKKRDAAEAEVRSKVNEHPMIKAAQAVFDGEIKSIVPNKEGARK